MDPRRARDLLTAERERIERALARRGHEDDGEEADELDRANLAADLHQDELDEGLEEDLQEQLAAVERAEARLAAGSYGLSIESGEPIPDERLELLPTAELTVEEEQPLITSRRPSRAKRLRYEIIPTTRGSYLLVRSLHAGDGA